MKKIICMLLLLILMLSFTACSSGENLKSSSDAAGLETAGHPGTTRASNGSNDSFYYIEKDIGGKSGLIHPGGGCINIDDRLVVADGKGKTVSRFVILGKDGSPAGEVPCSLPGLCKAISFDAQNNIWAVVEEPNGGNEYRQVIYKVSGEGKITGSIDTEKLYGKGGFYLTGFAVGTNESIYLADPAKPVQVLDSTGKLLKTLGSGKYICICPDDAGNLFGLDTSGSKTYLEKINVASGKSELRKDITSDQPGNYRSIENIYIRYCKGDKSVYLNCDKGILAYSAAGEFKGIVLDYGDHTILASGSPVCNFVVDSAGALYLMTSSDKGFQLFSYTRQSGKEKKAVQKGTITVSLPYMDTLIDTAATRFQIKNPGFRVIVDSAPDDEKSLENYRTVLNTEIMAGKGPDIFSVNGLPYEKFIYRNSFADLTEMMEKDKSFDSGVLYSNLLDALKYKGKLYMLPISFNFDTLIANKNLLDDKAIQIDDSNWTWNDFNAILQMFSAVAGASESGKFSPMPRVSRAQLLERLLNGSYGMFIDIENKNSSFVNSEFMQILNIAKSFGSSQSSREASKGYLESIARGTLVFNPYSILGYMGYASLKGMYGDAEITMLRFPSDNSAKRYAFSSNSIFAINAKSSNKDEAYEFLKYLLSEEMQTDGNMSGFSVNREAQKKRAAANNDYIKSGKAGTIGIGAPGSGKSISFSPKVLTDAEIDKIDRYIEKLNVYSNNGSEILKIVWDESKAYLSGVKTAEDTARFIQQRVDTYMGE